MFMLKILIALAVMAAALWAAQHFLPQPWHAMKAQWALRIALVLATVGAAGLLYFCALLALGFRLRDFKRIEA
jgi:putative peptidoglycan lipid II flippase